MEYVTLKVINKKIVLQMIIVPIFDVSNHKSVISKKTYFLVQSHPQIGKNFTYLGVLSRNKIGFLLITDFGLETSKNDPNIIIWNTQFFKVTRLWLKNWVCNAHLNFEIQKGVAGTIIELQPWKFGKISIFWRCSNDISIIFSYSYWFPT